LKAYSISRYTFSGTQDKNEMHFTGLPEK
jgi:hypothetical protein